MPAVTNGRKAENVNTSVPIRAVIFQNCNFQTSYAGFVSSALKTSSLVPFIDVQYEIVFVWHLRLHPGWCDGRFYVISLVIVVLSECVV